MSSSSIAIALPERKEGLDFIRERVQQDLESDRYGGRVVTRFPPEPNGYLHIGHAKSIALNFGVAEDFGGTCHLRFDDTNPETEDPEYVESIKRDIHWLGHDWGAHLCHASDYFEQLYAFALQLIKDGNAYVDSLNEEQIRAYRGTVTEAGRNSPFRTRTVAENLDLFQRMRKGEFPDGAHVLRAKGDMAADNMKMRDPLLYRIRHASHYRTGDEWCIYPMYDFAHPLSDAIEQITHSICTLEFENNRAIYDWLMDNLFAEPRPHQYEFARLSLDYTVMSKRKLLQLVEEGYVSGWDDPRMPTIAGLRRRGYTPGGIQLFCQRIGVNKTNSRVQIDALEDAIRDDLNTEAPRVMAVLHPLKVTLTNYPADKVEWLDAPYWPRDIDKSGSRQVPLTQTIYIERSDFAEDPPADWARLSPGGEVRLRHGYFIRCDAIVRDPDTRAIVELRCSYDPDSIGKPTGSQRKRSTAIQWVSADHAIRAEVRLYAHLFTVPDPEAGAEAGKSFKDYLNPKSMEILTGCMIEPSRAASQPGERFQFLRHGYFIVDEESTPDALVFNRIVELPNTYARSLQGKGTPTAETRPTKDEPEQEFATGSISDDRARLRAESPELAARHDRYIDVLGLTAEQADVLTGSMDIATFFEAALIKDVDPSAVANWVNNEVIRELKGRSLHELPFGGSDLGALVRMIDLGMITSAGAKTVFAEMMAGSGSPDAIVKRLGLDEIFSEAQLNDIIDQVLAGMPAKVDQYRAGKTSLLGPFTGQVMKASGGRADPRAVQALLKQKLQ